ncbi:MAG: adenylyl-sulfate kinase, partial [Hydrogenophilales bacterium CG_4_8_14_3_um_filter_62_83]
MKHQADPTEITNSGQAIQAASPNVVWHQATVTRARREAMNGHNGCVIWFTGLSGSGKSTLAHALEEKLHQMGCRTYVLDGDNVRHGLCGDLGFTEADRKENIRRIGEVAKLLMEAGIIVLTAFISPYRADRQRVRGLMGHGEFLEVYCACPLAVCEQRDVKGLYKKARAGEVKNFTGINSPYETPEKPELTIDTTQDLIGCVGQVTEMLRQRGKIP